MNTKKPKGITITIRPNTHAFLSEMANSNYISIIELMELVVEYMKKTGYDPKDKELQSPAEEIKKFRNTFISFMRTHEKEFLIPLVTRSEVAVNTLIDFMKERDTRTPNTESVIKNGFKIPSENVRREEI